VVQVVTLTRALADTGKDRVTTVGLGNVVDELLNEHSLADTGTAEKTNLATTGVRREQVDDLDARLEHLGLGRLLDELWRVGVDGGVLDTLDLAAHVDRLANDVHDAAKGLAAGAREGVEGKGKGPGEKGGKSHLPERGGADGDHDGGASVNDLLAADETTGRVHGNGADSVLTQVLGDLEDEAAALGLLLALGKLDLEGVQDGREVVRVKVDVDDGTNDRLDRASLELRGGRVGAGSGWVSAGMEEKGGVLFGADARSARAAAVR
jgi:peptide chain release factor 1